MKTPDTSIEWWITRAASRPLVCIPALCVVLAGCARSTTTTPEPVIPPSIQQPVTTAVSSQDVTRDLVLMGTTDVHGRIYPYDYYTRQPADHGLARLKPLIDSVRAANPGRAYLFDSGDLLQGNSFAFVSARINSNQPGAVIRAMNFLRYDASALGNHEYNYGLPNLARAMQEARFPFVAANIFRHGTSEHAYRPYVLLRHTVAAGDTILIGVTGNTPPGVHVWDKANVDGILDFRDVTASLKPVVAELKAQGADVVVLLSHGGFEGSSYDTLSTGLPAENASAHVAREVPGIDVIFMGHTHGEIQDTTINGVLITQPKNWAQSVSVVTLSLQRRGANDWATATRRAVLLRARPQLADTAFLDSMRWEHERAVEYVSSVVGTSTTAMPAREARVRDTAILDFINEVQRRAAGSDLSATAAFRIEGGLQAGPVTIADLAGLYVYDNTLKAVRINGSQLRAYLEKSAEYYRGWPRANGGTVTNFDVRGYNFDVISGVDYTIDLSKPVGQRITRLSFRGAPVSPEQTFTLALNNYRQTGGGGFSMLAGAPVVYDRQEEIRELLLDEVRRRGTIRAADYFNGNWRIAPAAAASAALTEQLQREVAESPPAPQRTRLRVVSTNDFHGRLLPEKPGFARGREVGGAAALSAYFKHERAGFDGPTLILDGGDVMQGTPVSNLTQGRSSVAFFNEAGYGAAAIGNHEFDWGVPVLRARVRQARFAWLSANMFMAGTDTAPSWVRPAAMLVVDGVKVGVMGLSTEETPFVTKAINVREFEFRSGSGAMNHWVPELRRRGADFVVVVAHSGAACDSAGTCKGEMIDWARATSHPPDLIVAGHTHLLVQTRVNGIAIVEAGSYSTRYSVTDLERISPDSVSVWIRDVPTSWVDRVKPDSAVAALVARFVKEIGPRVDERITTIADTLARRNGEHALGRLVADAQRWAGKSQVALINNGGIRADIGPGPLTWGDVYEIQPFENRLVRLTLTGTRLRETLEHVLRGDAPSAQVSGLRVQYDPARPARQRVISVQLEDGAALRDDATYTVVVNDFMAGQGDAYTSLANPVQREDLDIVDLDALLDYLKTLPAPVRAPADRRFVTVGASS